MTKKKALKLEDKLSIKMENSWFKVTKTQEKEIFNFADGYKDFLTSSKTEREVVKYLTAKAEEAGFKHSDSVKKLKPGDVLIEDLWRGITEKDLKELRKKGGEVWVKEGVRFAPVFIITILLSIFYGSFFVLIYQLVAF